MQDSNGVLLRAMQELVSEAALGADDYDIFDDSKLHCCSRSQKEVYHDIKLFSSD